MHVVDAVDCRRSIPAPGLASAGIGYSGGVDAETWSFDPDHHHESAAPSSKAPTLFVTCGRIAGSKLELEPGGAVTIGRASDAVFFLDDVTVSRRHAVLEAGEAGYRITDLGSLNGTYLNGERVETAVLRHGDELRIGRFCITYVDQ